jgi:membrane associated rhomboid family serine protease
MNPPAPEQRCYRHPDREAYISCQRCGRLICPECMNDASVGFQCPSCIAEGAKTVRSTRTMAGGAVPAREGRVSMVIIGLNVLVFVLTDVLRISGVTEAGSMIAASVRGEDGTVYPGVAADGYWRLVSSAFLHAGVLHLALNMYALYLFGPFVERALGTWRFIAAYLTTAVVASAFVYVLADPRTYTVGASGAVFGLFAMALLLLLRARQDVTSLLVLLAINAVISTTGNISWQGHLGGFVGGLVLGAAFAYAPRSHRQLVQALAFGALWAGVVAAVVLRTAALTG